MRIRPRKPFQGIFNAIEWEITHTRQVGNASTMHVAFFISHGNHNSENPSSLDRLLI